MSTLRRTLSWSGVCEIKKENTGLLQTHCLWDFNQHFGFTGRLEATWEENTTGAFTPGLSGSVDPKLGDVSSLARFIWTYTKSWRSDAEKPMLPTSPGRGGLGSIQFEPWSGSTAVRMQQTQPPEIVLTFGAIFNMDSIASQFDGGASQWCSG